MPIELRREAMNWQRLDDEIVVLDLRDSEYLRLNDSGALLWELLAAGPTTVSSLAVALADTYAISEAEALDDAREFVAELRDRALVVGDPT